jgi:hypothetical protein
MLDEARAVAVVGDLQMTSWLVRAATRAERNVTDQARLLADLEAKLDAIGALVLVGDLVYTAWSRSDWRHFDALMAPFEGIPLLPALGNHDYHCLFVHLCTQRVVPRSARLRFPSLAPGRAYWTSYVDVALVFLDSETGLDAQSAWLDALLDEIDRTHAAAVLFAHRPPFTNSTARGLTPAYEVRTHILPVLEGRSIVPVVVSGHAHGFEHLIVEGRHYVVSGGAGGPRSVLMPTRPNDVYGGHDCLTTPAGAALRPFNYVLLTRSEHALELAVHGLCKSDTAVRLVESFAIDLDPQNPARNATE